MDVNQNIVKFNGKEPFNDYIKLALIHKDAINEGFLSTMDSRLLAELYKTLARSRYGSLFVSTDEKNTIVAFIAISYSTSSFYKEFFLKKAILLAPYLLRKLISINFIIKLFETIFYPFKRSKNTKYDIDSEILNFCVDEKYRGTGIGKVLFKFAKIDFCNNKIKQIKIVTGENQRSAQIFYEKIGAKLIGDIEIHKNSKSFVYKYKF
tara:strand:- start:5932 stop:6555 length:624 start_codon:yes stop_codon:yes gene_type:complete